MGRIRFVKPETERLSLSDGDWIEVKKDLNTGELKKLEAAGHKPPVELASGRVINPLDWERHELERAMVFLTGWSFKGFDDKPVELTMDALKSLEPPDFEEINKAIFDYTIKRAAEKKSLRATSEPTSPAISVEVTSS